MVTNKAITVTVDADELAAQVVRIARDAAEEIVASRFDDFLRAEVDAAMSARVRELTDERIRAEVERVFADGWQKTNSYGEPTGQKTTLASIVREWVTDRDSFRNPVDRIFKEQFEAALKCELKPLLAEAKERLRALVDKGVADKLRTAVTEAFR